MSERVDIVSLAAPIDDRALNELADVLVDCVEGGASVNFMSPYSHEAALAFFRKVAASVGAGDIVLLAARCGGKIVGTVQLASRYRRTSVIAPTSRKCWCIARAAAAASERR